MGIDFGSKKIGIALTDDAGNMAFPHEVVPNDARFFSTIEQLVTERKVAEIVVGQSLDNQGNANAIQTAINDFITEVTLHIGIPVHLEPEQYSTQQAARITGKNEKTDAAAAALILESFIAKERNT